MCENLTFLNMVICPDTVAVADLYCKCPGEDTTELEPSISKRQRTTPPPATPNVLDLGSHKATSVCVESIKPQTPCSGINVCIRSPNDMHFRVHDRAQEGTGKSPTPTSLADLGYTPATTLGPFPHRRSLFQAGESSTSIAAGTTSNVGSGEKIEIIISRICDST